MLVREPTPDEALEILEGLRPKYEQHHSVEIDPDALLAVVELSTRYVPDRQLPDKALDLLDAACARVTIPALTVDPFDDEQEAGAAGGRAVTASIVAEVLQERTGLAAVRPGIEDSARLADMEEALREQVIGQDTAVERVAAKIRLARSGLRDKRKPLAVFLFLGPTGVGKTQLAKSLAQFLFESEDDLIRLDMSEYQEQHTVSKLIGAPPGYVGYEDEGQLTGKLRSKPFSVVLLDEVEKAHPRVHDVFLQVFDEGRLTDSKGRTVTASQAVLIMTSNLPPRLRLGFSARATAEDVAATLDEVRSHFRPEFLNRVDEQIVFRQLTEAHVRQIARKHVERVKQLVLETHQIGLSMTEEAEAVVAERGYDERYGVRELARCVERLLTEPLIARISAGGVGRGDRITARAAPGGKELEFTSGYTTG